MNKIFEIIITKRRTILVVYIVLTILSIALIPLVNVNYDNTKYLPKGSETVTAMAIHETEFGLHGSAQLMIPVSGIADALDKKHMLEDIDGVLSVFWLDDATDINQPLDFIKSDIVSGYFKNGKALYQINFSEGDYSPLTGDALAEIQKLAGSSASLRGPAVESVSLLNTTTSETFKITIFIIPLFLLILLLMTSSWFEPVLFVLVIAISVVINMGTNAFFNDISYMTNATAALLQFAVAMDYSIFLLHRFREERINGSCTLTAMKTALTHSFTSITASSLTTIAGFLALTFMRYSIGLDLGIVLAKGVFLSLITVLTLMPALIIMSENIMNRTNHRYFMPSFKKFSTAVVKLRYIFPLIMICIFIPSYIAQGHNNFLYGESATAVAHGTQQAVENNLIENTFGRYNPVILLMPKGEPAKESNLYTELSEIDAVNNIQALAAFSDTAIPREIIPANVLNNFEGPEYSRMIIMIDAESESDIAFATVNKIEDVAKTYYGEKVHILGSTFATMDIRSVVESDFTTVNMFTILAVGLILLFTFRSILIPLLLILVIEGSIWINMSIAYFTGYPLIFIGYMIVSAIQLGATIDYAILITTRYRANRSTLSAIDSAKSAIRDSCVSIITSAGIMCSAGFSLGFISKISGVSSLGILIGRGALLSGFMVLILLPQLLVLTDKLIYSVKSEFKLKLKRKAGK